MAHTQNRQLVEEIVTESYKNVYWIKILYCPFNIVRLGQEGNSMELGL